MFKVLLVDDEPLVLIGLQGMLDWNSLGWEIAGTARNGSEALSLIRETDPDLVLCDIRMPVMDGLELAGKCREQGQGLPLFVMLTSYEEFNYVRQSMTLGAMEYLIKLDLTPQILEKTLRRAEERIERERALLSPAPPPDGDRLAQYRSRLFLQLYSGLFGDPDAFRRAGADLGLEFDAPCYTTALGVLQNRSLDTKEMATLSSGIINMAAGVLPKYMPCTVTAMGLHHFSALFPLQSEEGLEEKLRGVLEKAGEILYGYFGTPIWWAVGEPVNDILETRRSHQSAFAARSQLSAEQPIVFVRSQSAPDYHAQQVAKVKNYICKNLDKRLSLNEVASVFNFSPNYLSQLFAQWGESGFVEFVTATRINAAKELMATTNLKIYEIGERLGFESAFYFSKVFKKVEGVTPREYMQRLRGAQGS